MNARASEFELRLATIADVAALTVLMTRSIRELSKGFYSEAQIESAAKYIGIPDPEIIEDHTYFAVERLGVVIACGGWSRRRKLFRGAAEQEDLVQEFLDPSTDSAKIRAMFVDPDYRRQGLGEMIYLASVDAARGAGYGSVELMATMPGVPFYRRMGFGQEEPLNIQLPDGTNLPGIQMYKFLGA
ncbi:MAG: GNAT family N-acetyltransferase [Chlorobia bacterium]|nr:GNAT family N-acetyltransferase [Fimbriimonadaceae bacterium]